MKNFINLLCMLIAFIKIMFIFVCGICALFIGSVIWTDMILDYFNMSGNVALDIILGFIMMIIVTNNIEFKTKKRG